MKLSLISRNMVEKTYTLIAAINPGRNILMKFLRSSFDIGNRLFRTTRSSSEGGGIFSSKKTEMIRGVAKASPVLNGTHNSEIPKWRRIYSATDLTNPEEKI